eukprot:TRINITY_DN66985_c0_g1_i1.p1 TRINITY_DN66985_c0_g1~~TRINITY_DN66985_c0_g1_i1.p1  ORF type:complete len:614 (+),score=244.91 TRINITY_DN66985_c0_g1_i1:82-1842(+)
MVQKSEARLTAATAATALLQTWQGVREACRPVSAGRVASVAWAAGAACGALAAALCCASCVQYHTDEGTRRMVTLYRQFAPLVLYYRWLENKQRLGLAPAADEEWEAAHQYYAPRMLAGILGLRGFYVKIGQVLAGRPDLCPELYIEHLRTLEDQVPPHPGKESREVIERSLGVPTYGAVFREWDDEVLGSASIGQVHRARLRCNGREVAVKVQYPGVERLFRADMKTFKGFCARFAREQLVILDEIERQFLTEFDYREEARNLDQLHRNMRPFARRVVVPEPHLQYCTKEVLVMDYLAGPKLHDAIRDFGTRYARSIGTTFEQLERDMRERFRREGLPPPYAGPGPVAIDAYRALLRARDAMANLPRLLWNITAPWAGGRRCEYTQSLVPPNAARIMQTLLDVHAHQLLVNGCFNADPHAGNFLLMPDGRIGLIDFGQVKRLTPTERFNVARAYRLLNWGVQSPDRLPEAKRLLIKFAREGGYVSKYFDPEVCWNISRFSLDSDGPDVTQGLNPQQFLDQQFAADPWSKTADEIVMPTRMSFMLRGVGLALNHPVSIGAHFAPVAERVLTAEAGDGSIEEQLLEL